MTGHTIPAEMMYCCESCGQPWSIRREDYPWLHPEEMLICSCGNPLFRIEDLADVEFPLIQAVE